MSAGVAARHSMFRIMGGFEFFGYSGISGHATGCRRSVRSVDRRAQIVGNLFEPKRITLGISEDIWHLRGCGVVRCGVLPFPALSPASVAKAFELRDDDACYREIDESEARCCIAEVLHRDQAYRAELMTVAQAEQLTAEFLEQFGAQARYFTNNWCSVTDATFDTGVIVIGALQSGCLWVEDED
ncbi:hypothetical protein [Burkholderia stagnalis]|uniref:hypothetical protein n=1 Tax=Burkholderia stagnalis TaxID=1503054 RepID=UPI000F572315|nr:hypothetical protein [Burkholderia stagnalis]